MLPSESDVNPQHGMFLRDVANGADKEPDMILVLLVLMLSILIA